MLFVVVVRYAHAKSPPPLFDIPLISILDNFPEDAFIAQDIVPAWLLLTSFDAKII